MYIILSLKYTFLTRSTIKNKLSYYDSQKKYILSTITFFFFKYLDNNLKLLGI